MKNKKLWVSLLAGIMAAVMILTLLLQLIPVPAEAASSSEIQNQIDEMEKEQQALQDALDELESKRDANQTEIESMVQQKDIVDQQISLLYEQIDNMNDQIAAYAVMIADKQTELDKAEADLQAMKEKHLERIRALEEDGQLSYWSVLFEASSFFDFLDRLSMVEEIAAADSRRLKEMRKAAEEVEAAKAELLTEREEMKAAKAMLDETQAELEAKSEKAQELLSALIAKGEEFEALMGQLEDEQKEYSDMLADKKAEYDEAKYKEYMATATQPTRPSGGGNGGKPMVDTSGLTWVIPCDYTMVSSAFGWRVHPIEKVEKFHNGVDLWAPGIKGKPIYATREGVVAYSGWYGSGGHTVKIDHLDGFQSIYMHMTNYIVKEGDFVTAGQIIGYVGSTGGSTGPHLHFEIRYDGTPYNPMQFIG